MIMSKVFTLESCGLKVRIGKFARQSDGAVWIEKGSTVVLSTAVASDDEKEFAGFFPLTVEYREKTSAAGKIPGGYIKREGRLSDGEVLTSRLIDRPIRPLFPKYYFNEVQLLSSVYSYDGSFSPAVMAILSSSLALTLSNIPFQGPIGAVLVGKVNGEWKLNPTLAEVTAGGSELIVAGTKDGISMVEGNGNNMTEDELIDLLFVAHEEIKKQIDWQLSIQKELGLGIQKEEEENPFWVEWEAKVGAYFKKNFCETLFSPTRQGRKDADKKLEKDTLAYFDADIKSGVVSKSQILFLHNVFIKKYLPDVVSEKGSRLDGRNFVTVRPLQIEVALLPAVHGSSVFTRGDTQALASLTLGTAQDAQKVESLEGAGERTFMLHYNFPPFATGEVKAVRGVGRREIGHGYLAERSFKHVLPSQEEFPYTIRSLVDILESNGSSSMASVCATTMALMDAGVPVKEMVGGIAMGLMKDSSGKFHVLTDILGAEDALGLMDFKVTGSEKGIMAVQMDIKAKAGLTREILHKALEQARQGRLHIINAMKQILDAPRKELSELAPRVISFRVDTDKIGLIIGPGGKSIKEITASTNTQIDINDDGLVRVYSQKSSDAKQAEQWIKTLIGNIEVGAIFDGKIRRTAEFGLFVELVPGKDGLVHISSIAHDKQRTLFQTCKVGDTLKVKVVAVEAETGRIRLVAPELSK